MSALISAEVQYMMLEVHYDNPLRTPNMIDQSSLTLYYQDAPRPRLLSSGLIGPIPRFMQIPHGVEQYEFRSVVGPACTSKLPHEISIYDLGPHMHQVGKTFKFR